MQVSSPRTLDNKLRMTFAHRPPSRPTLSLASMFCLQPARPSLIGRMTLRAREALHPSQAGAQPACGFPHIHHRGSHAVKLSSLADRCLPPGTTLTTQAGALKHRGQRVDNQDAVAVHAGAGALPDIFFVADGHGSKGQAVAEAVAQAMPRALEACMNAHADEPMTDTLMREWVASVFGGLEQFVQHERCTPADLELSGCTASLVLQLGVSLFVAHVGDSRVLLGSGAPDEPCTFATTRLTTDHRLDDPLERERCLAAGARVGPSAQRGKRSAGGVDRLWLPGAPLPGLAITRSVGDSIAKRIGCSGEPEMTHVLLRPGVDHHLVIASDGVWDVLTDEEAMGCVYGCDAELGALKLLKKTIKRNRQRPGAKLDNISVVVLRFTWDTAKGGAASRLTQGMAKSEGMARSSSAFRNDACSSGASSAPTRAPTHTHLPSLSEAGTEARAAEGVVTAAPMPAAVSWRMTATRSTDSMRVWAKLLMSATGERNSGARQHGASPERTSAAARAIEQLKMELKPDLCQFWHTLDPAKRPSSGYSYRVTSVGPPTEGLLTCIKAFAARRTGTGPGARGTAAQADASHDDVATDGGPH